MGNMNKKSITVLGLKVKIKLVKNLTLDGQIVHGYFDAQKALICVEKNLSIQDQYKTLFHEISHALTFRNGMVFSGFPSCMDEILAETNANMIYELMTQFFGEWHD
jgi:Zn-dependent peptidase ImmA (M78 family)